MSRSHRFSLLLTPLPDFELAHPGARAHPELAIPTRLGILAAAVMGQAEGQALAGDRMKLAQNGDELTIGFRITSVDKMHRKHHTMVSCFDIVNFRLK